MFNLNALAKVRYAHSQTARLRKHRTEHLSKFDKHLNKILWILYAWLIVMFVVGAVSSINTLSLLQFSYQGLIRNYFTC